MVVSHRFGSRVRVSAMLVFSLSPGCNPGDSGVDPTPPPSACTNEPPDFITLRNVDFASGIDGLGGRGAPLGSDPDLRLDRVDGRNVVAMRFPEGKQAGTGTPYLQTGLGGATARQLYHCYTFKYSENWVSQGIDKQFYFIDLSQGAVDPLYLAHRRSDVMQFRSQGAPQPTGTNNFSNNITEVTVAPGSWYTIEVLLRMNSAPDVQDGEGHMWINGTKVLEMTDFVWSNGNRSWDRVRWDAIYGGTSGQVPNTQYMYIDDWYTSYRGN